MTASVTKRHVPAPRPRDGRDGYDVVLGNDILTTLSSTIHTISNSSRVIVCSDATVGALHAQALTDTLAADGLEVALVTFEGGEAHKTLDTVQDLYDAFVRLSVERGNVILALGGGVVGDIVGFAAATYLRGLPLVQCPTTLVAQVDSAIGGKVGADLPAGKNLVGAFHDPIAVFGETQWLQTLPEREWIAGLAEAVKSALIADANLSTYIADNSQKLRARDMDVAAHVVGGAASVKVVIVSEDPFEQGRRRILNYGHTFGHAIETVAGYGVVLHGEAIAWGMAAAARIGAEIGTCAGDFVTWQDDLLASLGLLQPLPALDPVQLVTATQRDKKMVNRRLQWILPERAGEVVITDDVPAQVVNHAAAWLPSR